MVSTWRPSFSFVTLTGHRLGSLLHSLASTQGHHTRCDDIPIGIHKSLAPLVYRVVVGEIQMGDTMLSEGSQPFGFCAEDELLEDGRLNLRSWALEIAHDNLRGTKDGVDTIRKQMVDSVMIDDSTHSAIEQNVACEDDA